MVFFKKDIFQQYIEEKNPDVNFEIDDNTMAPYRKMKIIKTKIEGKTFIHLEEENPMEDENQKIDN